MIDVQRFKPDMVAKAIIFECGADREKAVAIAEELKRLLRKDYRGTGIQQIMLGK